MITATLSRPKLSYISALSQALDGWCTVGAVPFDYSFHLPSASVIGRVAITSPSLSSIPHSLASAFGSSRYSKRQSPLFLAKMVESSVWLGTGNFFFSSTDDQCRFLVVTQYLGRQALLCLPPVMGSNMTTMAISLSVVGVSTNSTNTVRVAPSEK